MFTRTWNDNWKYHLAKSILNLKLHILKQNFFLLNFITVVIVENISMENSEILGKLQKEIEDQKTKLQRAEREVKISLKAVKERNLGKEFVEAYERELDLREFEYRNSSALNQLADMAENDDDIGPKVIRIMLEKGLKMPHLLQKTRSFASWRSDMSETSSSRG